MEERGSIGDSDGGPPVSAWVARGSGTATATGEAPATPEVADAGPNGADGSSNAANRLLAEGAQQQEGFPISNRDGAAINPARTSHLPLSNAPVAARDARDGANASLPPSDGEDLTTTPLSSSKGGVVVVEGSGAGGQPEQEEREGKDNAGVGNTGQAEGAAMASGAKKDDDVGFGEHGWYSTSSITEDHIG